MYKRLPIKATLLQFLPLEENYCILHNCAKESIDHLFHGCKSARKERTGATDLLGIAI